MNSREEWLTWRRGGLGGSDVAALVGLSPWQSPWSIWADKAGLLPLDDAATEAQEFGLRAEPMMAGYFHDRTGLYVAGEQTWCSNPDDPWMRCTVDGFVFDSDVYMAERGDIPAALGVAEWKTSSDTPAEWEAEIPAHYACQAQWSMAVTGMPTVWFGVLHLAYGHPSFRVYEVPRDEEDIALLTKAARAFWIDHCLTGTPPPTDGSDATTRALAQAWEPVDGETVEADALAAGNAADLLALKAEAKRLEAQIACCENALRAALGEATALTHGVDDKGRPVVLATWKPQTTTRVDVHALTADHPDLAEKYAKTTESRVLRLKTPKGT